MAYGKFSLIPPDTFKKLQLGAGMLVSNFNPESPSDFSAKDIFFACSRDGYKITIAPENRDRAENIANVPMGTKELLQLKRWNIEISGTAMTVTPNSAKQLLAAADVSGKKVTLRDHYELSDFKDVWWVSDYSDDNSTEAAGYAGIHLRNSLSTNGFQIQTGDDTEGQFPFTIKAFYSLESPQNAPCEIYISRKEEGPL